MKSPSSETLLKVWVAMVMMFYIAAGAIIWPALVNGLDGGGMSSDYAGWLTLFPMLVLGPTPYLLRRILTSRLPPHHLAFGTLVGCALVLFLWYEVNKHIEIRTNYQRRADFYDEKAPEAPYFLEEDGSLKVVF